MANMKRFFSFNNETIKFTLLVIILLGAFGAGKYYHGLYLQEISIILLVVAYTYLVVFTKLTKRQWFRWIFFPLVAIIIWVNLYAVIFNLNTGESILPSLIAGRGYIFWLVAPTIYLLYKSGMPIEKIEAAFYLSLILVTIHYLFVYSTIDLESLFLSAQDDPFIINIVGYDSWRGYRLKGPDFVFGLLMIMSFVSAVQSKNIKTFILYISLGIAASFSVIQLRGRAMMTGIVMSVMTYFLIHSKKTIRCFISVLIIIILMLSLYERNAVLAYIQADLTEDVSLLTRLDGYAIAFQTINEHPFFGLGQASYKTSSYSDLFGAQFYTADIGLMGVGMMYGMVGIIAYLLINYYVLRNLYKIQKKYNGCYAKNDPVIIGLLIIMVALSILVPIQTQLIFPPGITIAAFSMGISSSYVNELTFNQR